MIFLVIFAHTLGLLSGFAARCLIGYEPPLPPHVTTYRKGGRK